MVISKLIHIFANVMKLKNPKFITITTDASHSHQHKVGGYAFRIVSNERRINHSGVFKNPLDNSMQAELMCIANALHAAVKSNIKADLLVINTDCTGGIKQIKDNKTELANTINNLLAKLKETAGYQKHFIKHVKAHTNSKKSRNQANNWCDKESKKKMRGEVKRKAQKDLEFSEI